MWNAKLLLAPDTHPVRKYCRCSVDRDHKPPRGRSPPRSNASAAPATTILGYESRGMIVASRVADGGTSPSRETLAHYGARTATSPHRPSHARKAQRRAISQRDSNSAASLNQMATPKTFETSPRVYHMGVAFRRFLCPDYDPPPPYCVQLMAEIYLQIRFDPLLFR